MTHQTVSQELERQNQTKPCFPDIFIPVEVKPRASDHIHTVSSVMSTAEGNEAGQDGGSLPRVCSREVHQGRKAWREGLGLKPRVIEVERLGGRASQGTENAKVPRQDWVWLVGETGKCRRR